MNNEIEFCTFEERPNCAAGVKLLALSFQRHSPGFCLNVYLPPAMAELRHWLEAHCPGVKVIEFRPPTKGFAVKADVLCEALRRGTRVVWIDSDIIVLRDFSPLLREWPQGGLLLTANNPHPVNPRMDRCSKLGLKVIRQLDHQLNGSVLGLGREHQALLDAWKEVMTREEFLENQKIEDYTQRDPALAGDQEVMEGLLTSDHPAGFGEIPFRQILCGPEIAHEVNLDRYPVKDRIRNSLPGAHLYFSHLQGRKPWLFAETSRIPLNAASSFYINVAKAYREVADEPIAEWRKPRSRKSRWARRVTFDHPHLQGALWILLKKYTRHLER